VRYLSIVLLLIASVAEAQQLKVVKLSEKQYVAFSVDGDNYIYLGTYTSVKGIGYDTPDPPQPPPANAWSNATGGLHVMIVDDENLRGKLPQSQINIFTSTVLRAWLDKTCPKGKDGRPAYRLSSNDSLAEGGEARKQELPVYVQGWDLLMKSGVALPAWIVANGKRTTIEPLPKTVDAAIARLEALK
jgi:hypothetical protein